MPRRTDNLYGNYKAGRADQPRVEEGGPRRAQPAEPAGEEEVRGPPAGLAAIRPAEKPYEATTSYVLATFLFAALLFSAFQSAEKVWRRIADRPVPPVFVVLMYHSVKGAERERFARQMDLLLASARPVPADFVDDGAGRDGQPRVAITFDDGYRDNLTHAYPLFRQRSLPLTLYVPTDYPGGQRTAQRRERATIPPDTAAASSRVEGGVTREERDQADIRHCVQ